MDGCGCGWVFLCVFLDAFTTLVVCTYALRMNNFYVCMYIVYMYFHVHMYCMHVCSMHIRIYDGFR